MFVPAGARQLREQGEYREAYLFAIADCQRTNITAEELCSLTWYGRMKASAGPDFVDHDPWWQGRHPRRMKFRLDGTYIRLSEPQREETPSQQTASTPAEALARSGNWRFALMLWPHRAAWVFCSHETQVLVVRPLPKLCHGTLQTGVG